MIATVNVLVIHLMVHHCDPTVRALMVTVHVIGVTFTRVHTLSGYARRSVKETTAPLVRGSASEKLSAGPTTTEEARQKRSLSEWGTGLSMSVHLVKNTTTTVNRKSHSGRNLASGLIGRRTKSTSEIGIDTDVIGNVIVNVNMSGSTRPELRVVRQKDIPILIDLLYRIVIVVVVVTAVLQRLRDPQTVGKITETNPRNNHFHSRHNPGGTAMVGRLRFHFDSQSKLTRLFSLLTLQNGRARTWIFLQRTVLRHRKLQDRKLPLLIPLIQD